MIERILLATIDRDFNEAVLGKTRELAGDLNATVIVLHVVPEPSPVFPDAYSSRHLDQFLRQQQRSRQQAEQALGAALDQLQGVQSQGVLREARGRLSAEVIAQEADDQQVDLIVVGTPARQGLQRFFAPDPSRDVVRLARQPTLLVHAPPRSSSLQGWWRKPSGATAH